MQLSAIFIILTSSLWKFGNATSAKQSALQSLDNTPVVHFTLTRRGGTFEATKVGNDSVNLDALLDELVRAERRYDLTKREVRGNKLIRKAKSHAVGGGNEGGLMGDIAKNGTWCAHQAERQSVGAIYTKSMTGML